jgi:thiol-disulfide isomerase/thioredoxin
MKRLYLLIGAIAGVGLFTGVGALLGGGGFLAPAPAANLTPPSAPLSVNGEGLRVRSDVGPEIGQLASDFTLTDLQGEALKLSNLRGRIVLLNFWASTCPYCREEMPMLQKLSEKHPELVVIGVNVLEERAVIEGFVWEIGVSYRVVQDAWGEVSPKYRVTNIPATFLIDEQGVIVWRKFGVMSEAELEEQYQNLKER